MRFPTLVVAALLCASVPGTAAAWGGVGEPIDVACGAPQMQEVCDARRTVCGHDVVVVVCYPAQVCEHEPSNALCGQECDEVCQQLTCYPEPQATVCAHLQDVAAICERDPSLVFCDTGALLCGVSLPVLCDALGPEDCPDALRPACEEAFGRWEEFYAMCEPVQNPACEEPPCRPHPILGEVCRPVCRPLEPGFLTQPTDRIPECIP